MKTNLPFILIVAFGLSACSESPQEPNAAQRAIDELQQKYDDLLKDKVDMPVDWASEDLENIGDWEYRVENIAFSTADEFANQLNEYGNDRWEVIWLEKTPNGYLAFMKKPSISYLSKIPLSQLGRILMNGTEGSQ